MPNPDSLLALIANGLSICRVAASGHAGLLSGLFLTGLVGSLTHCTGMCGPFVLSQVAARLEGVPAARMREWHRLSGGALAPYHLGRATTYAALGAIAAGATGTLAGWGGFRFVAALLLAAAALVLLAMAAPGLKALLTARAAPAGWWSRGLGRWAAPLFARPTGWKGWLLGVLLGFLPCGLLYAALAAAAATGDALAGALAMLAFTAGTMPALLVVGLAGQAVATRWRQPMLRWSPLLLVANAGMLGAIALQLMG